MRLCVSHYIQHSTVRRSAKLELEVRPIRSVSAAPGDLVLVEPPKSSERLILVQDHDAAMRWGGGHGIGSNFKIIGLGKLNFGAGS
jgi:hypothetical protein